MLILAASDAHHPSLLPVIVVLLAGMLGAYICQRLKLSPVIGFFVAGAVIGPDAIGVVEPSGAIEILAEIGVAFLLFDVGLHLSFKRLWAMRSALLVLGPLQVISAAVLLGGVAFALGQGLTTALLIGAGLALSSTAVVAQGLREHRSEQTPLGQTAVSILVFQDLFIVFLLVLLPSFAGSGEGSMLGGIGLALAKIILAFGVVFLVGRYLLSPIFSRLTKAQGDEVFPAAALLFVLAFAWGASLLGLSLPLGAFLGGMALAESRYAHLVQTELAPFRVLLLGLFFINVGMSIDLGLLVSVPHWIALGALGLIAAKMATLFGASFVVNRCRAFKVHLSFVLAQGSEFAFVLFGSMVTLGLLSTTVSSYLTVVIGLSMMLTPALFTYGRKVANWVESKRREALQADTGDPGDEAPEPTSIQACRVIVVGWEDASRVVADLLEQAGVPYIGFDRRREVVAEARGRGFEVTYGSLERPRAAELLLREGACAVAILIEDPKDFTEASRLFKAGFSGTSLLAATSDMEAYMQVQEMGLDDVVRITENFRTVFGSSLLEKLGFKQEEIKRILQGNDPTTTPVVLEEATAAA